MNPNPEQQKAIVSESPLKAILAGAGSGKTFTLTECIKRRAGSSVMVVFTFTAAGAHELRKRLPDVDLAFCGTRHAYCNRLLQAYGHLIGYRTGGVSILPKDEQAERLLEIRDRLGFKISATRLLESRPLIDDLPARNAIYAEYRFFLKSNNMVDFDAILSEGLALLNHPEVRVAMTIDDLFVDEKQDDASIDWMIDMKIPAENRFFVGDPDQAIYEFRGANPRAFIEFARTPGVETILLEQNYRSDIAICGAANNLIAFNQERIPKRLIPVSTNLGELVVTVYPDALVEANAAAARCSTFGREEASVAVLYRSNFIACQFRDFLRGQGIPVASEGNRNIVPADWARAILILSLMHSPENPVLLERFLRTEGVSVSEIDRMRLNAQAEGEPPFKSTSVHFKQLETWERALGRFKVSPQTVQIITDRVRLMDSSAQLIDLLADLNETERSARESTRTEGIFVGTMHAAKGREWDVVLLPAFEQGLIPDKRSKIEEERRLAFVALTRARHALYISYAEQRFIQFQGETTPHPSQFIGELGPLPE